MMLGGRDAGEPQQQYETKEEATGQNEGSFWCHGW